MIERAKQTAKHYKLVMAGLVPAIH